MEPMVDVKVLEEVYGTPRSWWYTAAENGKVPSYRVGKYRRFRLSEIEAWLSAQRQGRNAAAR